MHATGTGTIVHTHMYMSLLYDYTNTWYSVVIVSDMIDSRYTRTVSVS
jgi:hypothetical protein